jgi:hypothetical protein
MSAIKHIHKSGHKATISFVVRSDDVVMSEEIFDKCKFPITELLS